MTMQSGSSYTPEVQLKGFSLQTFDKSAVAVVRVHSDTYDYDLEFGWAGQSNYLECESDDLPESLQPSAWIDVRGGGSLVSVQTDGTAAEDFDFQVLSLDQGGQRVYP